MKALSLHIGINEVDEKYYKGYVPKLSGCINDMVRMEGLAKGLSFLTTTLKNEEATKENIESKISALAGQLDPGGLLLITYSGHGAQLPDVDGDEDEPELTGKDQAWVTYNGFLLDDQLNEIYSRVKKDRRVLVISDSCFSGSMLKFVADSNEFDAYTTSRYIPLESVRKILKSNDTSVSDIKKDIASRELVTPVASIKLLAACTDYQPALESKGAGLYTDTFLKLFNQWSGVASKPDYKEFQARIAELIKNKQTPVISNRGPADEQFDKQFPLSVEGDNQNQSSSTQPPSRPDIGTVTSPQKKYRKFLIEGSEELLDVPQSMTRSGLGNEELPIHGSIVVVQHSVGEHPWDTAYALMQANYHKKISFIEPDIITNIYKEENDGNQRSAQEYIPSYPNPVDDFPGVNNPFIWHLDEQRSQLKKAREEVYPTINVTLTPGIEEEELVKIAHIDTGYLEGHITSPKYFDYKNSYTIQTLRENEGAVDYDHDLYPGEQQGHGNATRALLAGNYLTKELTNNEFEGFYGANPFARVISIKISETVLLVTGRHFAAAVDYAIDQQCDVITMSMAGLPSHVMAKAVNRAYENGIVIVSAAGNCFVKGIARITPDVTLYPARFDRVIAAVGGTCNEKPYLYDDNQRSAGGEFMQTCYGPPSVLKTTLAAYTPNVVWFNSNDPGKRYVKTGGGTSSATPQIAAAASLYIQKYKEELDKIAGPDKWKKVEIVRRALFKSAYDGTKYNNVFGNGLLKAYDALQFKPEELIKEIELSNKAKVGIALFKIINLFRNRSLSAEEADNLNEKLTEMVVVELCQVMYRDMDISKAFDDMEVDNPSFNILKYPRLNDFIAAVQQSSKASEFLKNALSSPFTPFSNVAGKLNTYSSATSSRGGIKVDSSAYKIVNARMDQKVPATLNTWMDEYEIVVEPGVSRDIADAGITISHSYNDQGMDVAILVEEESDGVPIKRWIFQNQEAVNGERSFHSGNNTTFIRIIPTEVAGNTRGFGKFLLKIFKWLIPKKGNVVGDKIAEFLAGFEDTKYELYGYRLPADVRTDWTSLDQNQEMIEQLKSSDKPIVLVLPGLLSTIEKGFNDFLDNATVQQGISATCNPIVLGFNMPTLKTGNQENAVELYNFLSKYQLHQKEFIVITRSSGTLVARALIENKPEFNYKKLIFMGGANQGTAFASKDNWTRLLNCITNFADITFGVAAPWMPAILSFVKAIALGAMKLPGINELEEGSQFLTDLNGKSGVDTSKYYGIVTDYEPKGIFRKIADEVVFDRLIFKRQSNDILVPDAGSFFLNPRYPTPIKMIPDNQLILNGSVTTSHFKYLEDAKVIAFILKQL